MHEIENGTEKISAKEYLGRNDIYELKVPASVGQVGSWAFSGMKSLRELWLHAGPVEFGAAPFYKSTALKKIYIYGAGDKYMGGLASVVCDYLTEVSPDSVNQLWQEVTEHIEDMSWLGTYDKRLLEYLGRVDDRDFELMWFGGEEDYDDTTTNVELYKREKRMKKLDMIFNRLVCSEGLGEEYQKEYYGFLRLYMEGYETLEYLKNNYPESAMHFREFLNADCPKQVDRVELFDRISGFSPEVIQLLVEYQQAHTRDYCIFDDFSL